jgi:hypothetical protein
MIVLVPIALVVPAVLMLIPPLLTFAPTPLSRSVQFAALVICLPAVTSVALNSAVKIMLRMLNPPLTLVIAFGMKPRHCGEEKGRRQKRDRQKGFPCYNRGESFRTVHGDPPKRTDRLNWPQL